MSRLWFWEEMLCGCSEELEAREIAPREVKSHTLRRTFAITLIRSLLLTRAVTPRASTLRSYPKRSTTSERGLGLNAGPTAFDVPIRIPPAREVAPPLRLAN